MTTPTSQTSRSIRNLTRDIAVNVVANLFAGGIAAGLVAAFGNIRWLWSVALWLVIGSAIGLVIASAVRSGGR